MPGPPNVWGYPACHLVAFLVPLRHQHSGISDCISFHTCALAWPLIVHHGCWLTTAASNLISHPPGLPTALSQSGARGRERFLLSPRSDLCFWYCPRGCIPSVAGRFSPAFQLAALSRRVFRFPLLHPSLHSTQMAAPSFRPLPGWLR